MEDELQIDLQDLDDESHVPATHNKLLGAVTELYEKKRVKASTRKEPSLEVSEFHLSQPDKKRGHIKVTDLAKVLNKRATHADISHKLKNAQKRAKTLPKPLEKIHQDKINRKAGFEHAKQQLNRWDAIVYKQKVAEQLSFPLKSDTIKIYESSDVSTLFRKPTELEIALATILKQPHPLADMQTDQKGNKKQDEEDFPLTLAEVIEKRKMMAKLRAQQSYQQAKAARHKKIKSKKFHQIQKRARVKEQLREFEELQRKDPEAALKKLEELERTRAEERVTLRHRSTGQWAKNLAVRAKYDKDARIALAEQLSKSRELTVKLAQNQESDSEKEGEEEENQSVPEEDPNNPWVVKRSKDMEEFVSGYRKYWESEGKGQEKVQSVDTAVKVNSYQEITAKPVEKDVEKENTEPMSGNEACHNLEEDQINLKTVVSEEKLNTPKTVDCTLSKNTFTVDDGSVINSPDQDGKKKKKKPLLTFNITLSKEKESMKKITSFNKMEKSPNSSIHCSVGPWIVSSKNNKTLVKLKSSEQRKISRINNSFKVTESKTAYEMLETDSENQDSRHLAEITDERPQSRKAKTLDELFEEVEDKLQDRVRGKIENIKKKMKKIEDDIDKELEPENVPSLEFKKRISLADVDEELIQQLGDKSEGEAKSVLSKTLATAAGEVKQTEDIDPNKFLKVTPRHLLSQVPEIMTEGEDALDDEDKVAEDRHLTISEAFADDDVVDQFQKEKEDEVKKSSVGDVDLSLPGWGSWAGHNMRLVPRRKRKKFVIKFPKAIPRRDTNRGNVIINEDADKPIREHQVSDVPFPFTSVEDYEASIRAPLGTTWMPQTAHKKLTLPPVVTKMGAVIAPMDESQLVSKDESLPTNNKKNKKLKPIKRQQTGFKFNNTK